MKYPESLGPKYFVSFVLIVIGFSFVFFNMIIPTDASSAETADVFKIFLVFAAVLLIAGLICLVKTIGKTLKVVKYNILKKSSKAYLTTATFKKAIYKTTIVITGMHRVLKSTNEYYTVVYDYTDETGARHENVESFVWLVPSQAEYLKAKGSFSIKCKGLLSAIVEEIPEVNSNYNVVERGSNLIESTNDEDYGYDINGQKVFDSQTARDISKSVGIFEDNGITDSYMIEKICDDMVYYFNKTDKEINDLIISVAKAFRANGYEISQNDAIGFADCYFEED